MHFLNMQILRQFYKKNMKNTLLNVYERTSRMRYSSNRKFSVKRLFSRIQCYSKYLSSKRESISQPSFTVKYCLSVPWWRHLLKITSKIYVIRSPDRVSSNEFSLMRRVVMIYWKTRTLIFALNSLKLICSKCEYNLFQVLRHLLFSWELLYI